MKKFKLWSWIATVIWLIQLVGEGYAFAMIYKLNMLPDVLLMAVAIFFVFLAVVTGLIGMIHRKGKKVGAFRRVLFCVLVALILACCVIGCGVIRQLHGTMNQITTPNTGVVERDVYVRTQDPAQKLEDAADYVFAAVTDYDSVATDHAITSINDMLSKTVSVRYFATFEEMINALLSEEVDALILNTAAIPILEDLSGFENLSENIRLLCSVTVAGWEPTEVTIEPEETTTPQIHKNVTNTPFIVYISGSDTRKHYLPNATNSDVNILALVNPNTKQVLLVNTPRDSYIPNPAGSGKLDKLTHCGIFGVECSIQALEDLYGIDISYYVKVNFDGFKKLVDAIGGITVYSESSFKAQNSWIQAGENHMDGQMALDFARERKNVSGGDRTRGKNQMKVIKAVINKVTSDPSLVFKYSDILKSLEGMMGTSLSMDEISLLVKMQLQEMPSWNVMSYAVNGTGGKAITYSMPGTKLSVLYLDEDLVDYTSQLIQRVMDGEILTAEDLK